ncbi:aromatic ring-hydroxylating dioxygenase subunit alpha [Trinickia dinghuensis]|uniref:Aromatic ring-hydroxylating dioxygenase subunit alpha n=1 Tax=Trinickia dinghuensis TaxID=2291023 RepID=A0A3D8JQF6_9BURK|nr:aromatic ring-hydroxylating dioxygenase subunit alpha [Trinickia dinghuensis]RDU94671.1 aromatic ring-hydroxylating dioxygenase subunit alpha [Trinickia dinghuensis]
MPFLRNAWYVAAWSRELNAQEPVQRTLLGESIVFFRDSRGAGVALSNRCPHRFAPLSGGKVRGDAIECPYHGLRFDRTGQCVHNPHGDGRIPPAARAASYPLMERYGAVWIWMGEPERAHAVALPSFDYLDERHHETSSGYLLTKAHYQLSADNLLDLSHFQFLHPQTLGSEQMAANGAATFEQAGDTVWSRRLCRGERLQAFVGSAYGMPAGTAVDRRLNVRWNAPGLLSIEVGVAPAGMPPECGRVSFSGHFLTPETEASTHYFFAFGLPKAMGEAARTLVEYAVHGLMTPFKQEDLPMLEAQQRALGGGDFWAANPVMLSIDGAAIRARRIMEHKLADELKLRQAAAIPIECRSRTATHA